jgi:recombination protein RecT
LVKSPAVYDQLNRVLGEQANSFASSLISLTQQTSLAQCDPMAVICEAMKGACLGFPCDRNLGLFYIIAYKGVPQFQMGYKGYVQLALRSGQYKHLNACEIYEGELESFDRLTGEIKLDGSKRKSDTVVGYAAFLETTNGFRHGVYWPTDLVKKHAERFSQAYKHKKMDSPWFTAFDPMAKKTVLKDLLVHWGPLSVQMQQAIRDEDETPRGPMRPVFDAPKPDANFLAAPAPEQTAEPPANDDQIPGAEVPTDDHADPNFPTRESQPGREGGETKPAPAPEPPKPKPGSRMVLEADTINLMTEHKITFDQLADALVETGVFVDAKNYGSIYELPLPALRLCMSAQKGILAHIGKV